VINKPPGWWCIRRGQPGRHPGECAAASDPSLNALPRAGIVHRLDKDTSGVMVIARTLPAHTALIEQLSSREVHRQYLAVGGRRTGLRRHRERADRRHPRDRIRMPCATTARTAVTHFRLRERFRATRCSSAAWKPGAPTRSACTWRTSSTHRRRSALRRSAEAAQGRHRGTDRGAARIPAARHCMRKPGIRHPVSGEPVRCSAPVPDDMQRLIRVLHDDTRAAAEQER
jgi:23S rRNA pseudouridine1911/1915/1917 synthase